MRRYSKLARFGYGQEIAEEPTPAELEYYSYDDIKTARGSGLQTGLLLGMIGGAVFVGVFSVLVLHKAVPGAGKA